MSKRSRLELPKDTDPQGNQPGLLFHSSPSSRSTIVRLADGIPAEDGHPNNMAQSQEPVRSDAALMSPCGDDTVYDHHPAASSLGVPRWNSSEMNQWPYRLFTTAPPTPSGGSTLRLGSFQLPPSQQDLEDLQNPSQPPPIDPTPKFVGQLSLTNLQIYNNCRGNRPSLWPLIAEEIYNLQSRYGELIIFIPGSESSPRYRCGVCSHQTTTNPVHTKPKRRWDASPDILSHGVHRIKPWFSNCGTAFSRNRDQRRHSAKCQMCKSGQRSCASPVQSSSASSPSFSPQLSLPPIPLYNDAPQEPVIPRSPIGNHNPHPGARPALYPSNMFHTRELAPPPSYPYWSQPNGSQWARQGVHYSHTYGPAVRESRPYNGIPNAQSEYAYAPADYNGGNQYPSYHPIDFGTNGRGIAPLVHPGHPNGPPYMEFPPVMLVLRESVPLGSNPSNTLPPAPSQYGTPGPRQDPWRQDGSHTYEKVRTSVIVSEKPAGQSCVEYLEDRGKRVERSYRLTAAFLSLLILSALFWFLVRYFLYP